jgi:ABC-type transport system involved in multi-copper enzyme maturation permease subunit
MSQQTSHAKLTLRVDGPGRAIARTLAVAGNTLREAGRNRLFYGLLAATALLLGFALVLSDLALSDQKARLVQDFGLFVIPLLCVITAVLLGALLLHKELERKTLYAILPKPVRRGEFLLGKWLGLCVLLAGELAALAAVWAGVLTLRGGDFGWVLVKALGLQYLELVLVCAVALFFSALSSPVLTGVFTAGVFLVGRVSYVIGDLMGQNKGVFAEVPAMRALGRVLLAVVPDLSTFNVSDDVLQGWTIGRDYLWHATAYGLGWTAFFLALGLLLFERRDLT